MEAIAFVASVKDHAGISEVEIQVPMNMFVLCFRALDHVYDVKTALMQVHVHVPAFVTGPR